jgi:hypothetical protein
MNAIPNLSLETEEIEITPEMIEAGIKYAENALVGFDISDAAIRLLVEGVLEAAVHS